MKLLNATITSIKADIIKGDLAITLKVALNQGTLATAQMLETYTGEDAPRMDVEIMPYQMRLFNEAQVPPTIVGASDLPDISYMEGYPLHRPVANPVTAEELAAMKSEWQPEEHQPEDK